MDRADPSSKVGAELSGRLVPFRVRTQPRLQRNTASCSARALCPNIALHSRRDDTGSALVFFVTSCQLCGLLLTILAVQFQVTNCQEKQHFLVT